MSQQTSSSTLSSRLSCGGAACGGAVSRDRVHRAARAIGAALLVAAIAGAGLPLLAAETGARGGGAVVSKLSRPLRRAARKLDRALIQIDRALVRIDGRGGKARARRLLRKAQRRLRRYLDDADLRCAFDELAAAIAVTRDRLFSPRVDLGPLTDHTGVAVSCIGDSALFADSHADGVFFLGTSREFDRFDSTTRVFVPFGRNGPFDLLKIRATGADLFVRSLKVFFEDGEPVESQSHRHIDDLENGHRRTLLLRGRFIDFIRIRAETVDPDPGSGRGRLKLWGVQLSGNSG